MSNTIVVSCCDFISLNVLGVFLTPESWLHEEDCGHTSANYSYLHQGRVVGFGSH